MDAHIKEKLEVFFSHYPISTHSKGEIVIKAGEPPAGVFYLKKGAIRQYSISPEGDEMTMNLYKPHAFFPMMWAINDAPNRFYFEAIEDVELCKAPRQDMVAFLKKEPEILFDLTSRILKGLDGVLAKMEYLMTGNAQSKVIFTLLNTAYRFGQRDKQSITITLQMTHRELAALSGVTRETFTREMKKLEGKKLIVVEHHAITISDINALEEELLLS